MNFTRTRGVGRRPARPNRAAAGVSLGLAALAVLGSAGAAPLAGPLFLVDADRHPEVTISWPTRSGDTLAIKAELPYTSPNERTPVGHNLEAFAAVGGTRLEKGAGHPDGGIVRAGFYKTDPSLLMFEDIADGAPVTVTISGVLYNRPGVPRPETVIQHLKYLPEDAAACGLGDTALDQYNTSDAADTLNGKITENNGRPGVLDGATPGGGTVTFSMADDGSMSMTAVVPYPLFRHIRDPWLRTSPGAFFEPTHFHVEFEVLPADRAEGRS